MNRTLKSLLSAGTAALALAGTAARADQPWWAHPTAPVARPIPSAIPDEPCPDDLAGFRELAFERHEQRRVELARARFYRYWNGNPWARERFQAWYGGQLEEQRVQGVARREQWLYRCEQWRGRDEEWREGDDDWREHGEGWRKHGEGWRKHGGKWGKHGWRGEDR